MVSAVKAMMFAVVLAASLPGASAAELDTSPPASVTAAEDDAADVNGDPADEAGAEDAAFDRQHIFSTLGALALGVVGLLWVRRRRTVEL